MTYLEDEPAFLARLRRERGGDIDEKDVTASGYRPAKGKGAEGARAEATDRGGRSGARPDRPHKGPSGR